MDYALTSSNENRCGRPFHEQILGANPQRSSLKSVSKRCRSGGLIDVERWFADNNQNVRCNQKHSFINDDPPFYIGDSTLPNHQTDGAFLGKDDGLLRSPKHRHTVSNVSEASHAMLPHCSCEEFRGVIDDLTVENRKLKKRLKKYGRLQPAHLAVDKLFEVRVYGLSTQKKRELEEMLRCFAINNTTTNGHSFPGAIPQGTLQSHNRVSSQKSPSASTSCSRPIDSAYASMPASAQTSTIQSANARHSQWRPEQLSMSKQDDIQSYLHDIPLEIQPLGTSYLSDAAKKKLVVRRLEALFTGKVATETDLSQPAQQQEVSHSAASADKRSAEANGQTPHKEGVREARIQTAKAPLASDPTSIERNRGSRRPYYNDDLTISNKSVPDQRPTRPLDLDLQRAQVAAENVEYIRHLGLSSPRLGHGPTTDVDGGWVYLNLLINMAQLHTVNVTLDFIRKAVSDLSAKLELSNDGRKVRWLGGIDGTQTCSDSESFVEQYDEANANESDRTRSKKNKRRKLIHCQELGPVTPIINTSLEESSERVRQQRSYSLLNYKPLFLHAAQSEADGDSYSHDSDSSLSSVSEDPPVNQKTIAIPLARLEASSRPSNYMRHDGPITFYKNAAFCSDLSGETLPFSNDCQGGHGTHTFDSTDLEIETQGEENGLKTEATLRDLEGPSSPSYMMKLDNDHLETTGSLIDFEPSSLSDSDPTFKSRSPVQFEASGIGGVQPKDNFIVDVKAHYVKTAKSSTSILPHLSNVNRPAFKIRQDDLNEGLHDVWGNDVPAFVRQSTDRGDGQWRNLHLPYLRRPPEPLVTYDIVSALRTDLPPSRLPPPSYMLFSASSSEGDSSVVEDAKAAALHSRFRITQTARKRSCFPVPCTSSVANSFASDCRASESDTEASMDLLAAARELDPDAIAAYEREFDGCMGSVIAGEASAASSAATLGEESRSSCDASFSDNDSEASL